MLQAIVNNIVVDVAFTENEIYRGLSDRSYVGDKDGMLFILKERVPFTMENMKTPIDMIWIDSNHIVTAVLHNAQPGNVDYLPDVDFSYVLEIAPHSNVEVGNHIPFKIIN